MPHMKRNISDLALFGGRPAFEKRLLVGSPNIVDRARFYELCDSAFDRRHLSNGGPLARRFESELARIIQIPHCVAVGNATVGLQVVAQALGLTGEIIVPAFTFAAAAQAFLWIGLQPVPCDVCPETHQLDLNLVPQLITPRTSAIVGVHLWGEPCRPEALESLARRHGLALLFDAAHALGSVHRGVPLGTFGDAEVFSFHATKFVNCFEGGAITTRDSNLAGKIRRMINFGFNEAREVCHVGTNAKLNEISAAMGLVGLENLDALLTINRLRRSVYAKALEDVPGIRLLPDADEPRNHQYIVGEVDDSVTGLTRDEILTILNAEGVHATRYFFPGLHHHPLLKADVLASGRTLPVTDALSRRVFQLPTGEVVELAEVQRLCELLRFLVAHGPQISVRLREQAICLLAPNTDVRVGSPSVA